jgi:hypothetical protein
MSGVQDLDPSAQITCTSCGECTDDWAEFTITNLLRGNDARMMLCLPCVDIVSLLLDIDLETHPDGIFRVTELGKIERLQEENN